MGKALELKIIPKHPISPMIEFLGHDTISGFDYFFRVTTIAINFDRGFETFIPNHDLNIILPDIQYETAINSEPIWRYESEEAAVKGHIHWCTAAWLYSKGQNDETNTEDSRVLGRFQDRIRRLK